jgi:circadian clock protein KaiB
MKSPIAPRRPFVFRLYVAGDTPNAAQALANLLAICRVHAPGRHDIEVVDVFREPERALADGVLVTPAVVKVSPGPVRTIVGILSRPRPLLELLAPTGEPA